MAKRKYTESPYNYGRALTAALNERDISKEELLAFLEGIINTIDPVHPLHNKLSLLKLDFVKLRVNSRVSCDALIYEQYRNSKVDVIKFLKREKRRLKRNEIAYANMLIDSYKYMDEAYEKCGLGGKIKRLWRNPML